MIADIAQFSLTVFLGFFAVMNPVTNIPVFLSLVEGRAAVKKRQIARKGVLTAFIIVALFTISGKYIFEIYGITIPAFKITGGILLFYIGFEMLMSSTSRMHSNQNVDDDDTGIGISPLAIPILAGPGTIVAAMNNVTDANLLHVFVVILIFLFLCLLTYYSLILSDRIVALLGKNLIAVIGKLMGLILAIMGVQMIIDAINILKSS